MVVQANATLCRTAWEQLKTSLKEHCDSIVGSSPARPEYEGDGDEVRIEDQRTGRTAFLNYEERVPCIRYETVRNKDRMDFRVSSDGDTVQLLVKGIYLARKMRLPR
jgi:hypothetical protein